MMRKIITMMITPKLVYAEIIRSPHKKKNVLKLKLERILRIATMMPDLKEKKLPYKERLQEMQLTKLKERRDRGDLITIYKLMNILEQKDRKI